jgi:hypothetical protein
LIRTRSIKNTTRFPAPSTGKNENISAWNGNPRKLGERIANELVECLKNPEIQEPAIKYSATYEKRGSC